jgi:hypothetical protein
MYHHTIRVSSFCIRPRYSSIDDYLPLNRDIPCKNKEKVNFSVPNVFALIEQFFISYANYIDIESHMKLFSINSDSVNRNDARDYKTLSAVIQSGAYGIDSQIINKNTYDLRYARNTADADIKPFSLMFYVPCDIQEHIIKKGILIFQEIGPYGVKSLTIQQLNSFLSENYNLVIETRSTATGAYFHDLLTRGRISEITCVRNSISEDPSDNFVLNAGKQERTYISPIFRQSFIDGILRTLSNLPEDAIVEILDIEPELLSDYDDIKFRIHLENDRYKTISIFQLHQLGITEAVPDDILMANGQPQRELLIQFMTRIAYQCQGRIVFE